MALNHGVSIVRDGLILHYDAANKKSFRGEPTENLFSNPLLLGQLGEERGGDWVQYGGTVNYEVVSETYKNGKGFSQRFQWESTGGTGGRNNGIRYNVGGLVVGDPCTFSFYGKDLEDIANLSVFGGSNWSFVSITKTPVEDGWIFYELVYTPNSSNTIPLYLRPNANQAQNGYDSLIYRPQFEQKPYKTKFVDGTRGPTVETGGGWRDVSNNGNNAEASDNIRFENGSILFENDSYFDTSSDAGRNSPITINGWVKVNETGTSHVINHYANTGNSWGPRVDSSNRFRIFNDTAGVSNLTHFVYNFSLGEWFYFSVGHDENGFFMYVNGELIGEGVDEGGGPLAVNGRLVIGQRGNGTQFLNGNIANITIYKKRLTPQEILQNYNALKSRFE